LVGFDAAVKHDNYAVDGVKGWASGSCVVLQDHVLQDDLGICRQLHKLKGAMLPLLLATDANCWSTSATLDHKSLQDDVLRWPAGIPGRAPRRTAAR